MKLNILIVDDSSTMRSMVKKILTLTGLPIGEFFEAGNGQEGLDQVAAHWVDLVLVDLNMPVMGGLEMIKRLRENPDHSGIPIVVISTESSQARITDILSRGIHFIHKPFRPEAVREIILEYFGGSLDVHE
jgi:two-component system, chemotaxis family, chemotaxis protein CheY